MEQINIDSRINWVDFYTPYLKNPKPCGKDKMHACCPFHQERHPSFWFNTNNGCFKCEGCGESGNATVFLSKIKGIDNAEAYKELLELAGIDTSVEQKKQSSKPAPLPDYGVEQYATEKHFMTEWLKDECGVSAGTDQSGKHIKIPYKDQDGKVQATRKRYNPVNPNGKFKWQKGSTLCLYGEWKIKDFTDYAILVEGESDSQSLWMLGLPTLGVPGATNFQAKWAEQLASIPRLYLHIEPDKGGQTFRQQMISKLYEGGYEGEVLTFTLEDYEVKDPSELYGKNGMDALEQVKTAMSKAETVDLKTEAENLPDLVAGMPLKLREPDGWKLSDDGIFKYDSRTEQYKRVCRTPIIIVKRLRNIETDEEKIQIAFKIRNNWRYGIFNSTTIYQSRNIVSLADLGALITSENAKQVVSFLEALESENIDRIKEAKSVSQLGWATEKNFLPGHGGNIVLDVEGRTKEIAQCMEEPQGSLREWIDLVSPYRKNRIFEFYIASALTPPLVDILKVKNIMVYNWWSSGGGKTAALKVAASIYGNPDDMLVSFYSTQVGIERSIAPIHHLPLCIDERQLAGSNQETLNRIVYMLTGEKSKLRGRKDGSVGKVERIRAWAIATGEEPLVKTDTKDGVSSRTIELYGRPFEDEKEASRMHRSLTSCYGNAWKPYIENIINADRNSIVDLHRKFTEELDNINEGQSHSHSDVIAAACVANYLGSIWIFKENKAEAFNNSLQMGIEILLMQPSADERNVNMKALQFIHEWLISNLKRFTDEYITPSFGVKEKDKFLILPTALNEALKGNGFDPKKTLKFLREKNILPEKDYGQVVKRMNGVNTRLYCYDVPTATIVLSSIYSSEQAGFIEIDEDDDLPF